MYVLEIIHCNRLVYIAKFFVRKKEIYSIKFKSMCSRHGFISDVIVFLCVVP